MNASNSSGSPADLDEVETTTRSGPAPRLPIEAPLVRAVRALEALKVQADLVMLFLEHAPDQTDQITAAVNELVARTNVASAAAWHFTTVRSCEGQG